MLCTDGSLSQVTPVFRAFSTQDLNYSNPIGCASYITVFPAKFSRQNTNSAQVFKLRPRVFMVFKFLAPSFPPFPLRTQNYSYPIGCAGYMTSFWRQVSRQYTNRAQKRLRLCGSLSHTEPTPTMWHKMPQMNSC